jgi:Protein of unknown function (DUF2000)
MSLSTQLQAPLATVPERCVIIVNNELPADPVGNAAAVLSLTIGQRHPQPVGTRFIDSNGVAFPGLIPIGISKLAATPQDLRQFVEAGTSARIDVVRFPVEGQQIKKYTEFLETIEKTQGADMYYVAIALVGERKPISNQVSKLALLEQVAS